MKLDLTRVVVLGLAAVACRATPEEGFEAAIAGGIPVRVVDARTGQPVPGAEVMVSPMDLNPYASPNAPEMLFAGRIGGAERFGRRWRCDARGETRIPSEAASNVIVARHGSLWGCVHPYEEGMPLTIPVEPDESVRAVCATVDGQPGTGAWVWIWAKIPDRGSTGPSEPLDWGEVVAAADGGLTIPHAQFWRARSRAGDDVRISSFVFWSDGMEANVDRPFPLETDAEPRFEVSSSGWIDITSPGLESPSIGDLRWIDAPPKPDEPDDVPEFPMTIGLTGTHATLGVGLGGRFEFVLSEPGFIDPRVAFDGPKTHGERVRVELPRQRPAARITGRVVDTKSRPCSGNQLEVWIEREGQRLSPDEDWIVTDADGRFELDFVPFERTGAVLVVEVDRTTTFTITENEFSFRGPISEDASSPLVTRIALAEGLSAGRHELGDLHCAEPSEPSLRR